jgi:hypothetical protein
VGPAIAEATVDEGASGNPFAPFSVADRFLDAQRFAPAKGAFPALRVGIFIDFGHAHFLQLIENFFGISVAEFSGRFVH